MIWLIYCKLNLNSHVSPLFFFFTKEVGERKKSFFTENMPIWTVSNLQHRWKFCQSVLGGYWEQVFHQHLRGHLLTPLPGQWEWNLERLWAFASLTFPWHAGRPLLETTLHFLCSAGVVVATGGPEVNEADVRVIYHLTAPTPPTEQVITMTVRPSSLINYPCTLPLADKHFSSEAHSAPSQCARWALNWAWITFPSQRTSLFLLSIAHIVLILDLSPW